MKYLQCEVFGCLEVLVEFLENFWSFWSGLGCFERSGVVWSILERPDEVEIG